jgi:hypothetical protein
MLTTDALRGAADRDFFYAPGLQFGIRKPAGWRFLPMAGSPTRPLGRASFRSGGSRQERLSFVAMVQDIPSPRHPRPTIQVSCRPAALPTTFDLRRLLEAQLDFLSHELPDFERLTCSFDNIIGGRRAAHVQFRYTLNLPSEGATWPMPVLAHNYLVPTPGLAFTVAMSSSADALYYDEGDFAAALSSVRIGSPDARVPGPPLDRSRVVGMTGARRPRPTSS